MSMRLLGFLSVAILTLAGYWLSRSRAFEDSNRRDTPPAGPDTQERSDQLRSPLVSHDSASQPIDSESAAYEAGTRDLGVLILNDATEAQVRVTAIRELGQRPGPIARAGLRQGLALANPQLKIEVLQALVRLGAVEAIPDILQLPLGEDLALAHPVLESLAQLGRTLPTEEAKQPIVAYMEAHYRSSEARHDRTTPGQKLIAVEALATLGGEASITMLREELQVVGDDTVLGTRLVQALHQLRAIQALPELRQHLTRLESSALPADAFERGLREEAIVASREAIRSLQAPHEQGMSPRE